MDAAADSYHGPILVRESSEPDELRWSAFDPRLGATPVEFEGIEVAIESARRHAPAVVIRTAGDVTYVAGDATAVPERLAQGTRSWPPPPAERAEIDAFYEDALRRARAEEEAVAHFEAEVASRLAQSDPAVRTDDGHEYLVPRSDRDAGIVLRQLDRAGQSWAARRLGGTAIGFGSAGAALALVTELSPNDPWIAAVVDAIERERHWRGGFQRQVLVVEMGEGELLHVSASANRESISAWGLDWSRMGAAPGIAGSPTPELPAVFLDDGDGSFFVHMARTPVDVWAVDVTGLWIESGPSGWKLHSHPIPADRLRLIDTDLPAGSAR